MVKSLASLLGLCCWASVVVADAELLEPCDEEFEPGYESRVDELIDRAVAGERRLSFTTIPSFTPESGVRVLERDGQFYVAHIALRESVWHSSWQPPRPDGRVYFKLTNADIPTTVRERPISEPLARHVTEMVVSEIGKAQISETHGLDGETYYFRTGKSMCGKTWSPEPGSRQAKLVALMNGLASVTHTTTEQSRERTLAAIYTLMTELSGE